MINKTSTVQAPELTQWLNPPQPARPLARFRLTLAEGETYTLSPSTFEVCVLSGLACLLDDEREVLLYPGEKQVMVVEDTVILASGDGPLVFEIALDAASEEAQHMKRQFYERMAARQQRIETEGRSERQC